MPRMLFALMLTVIAVAPSQATDGVLEINQACALAGCFSGDAAGFPVSIDGSAGRSYRLTSDLNVGDPNLDGIFLDNTRISLDFNGFSLLGFAIGSGSGKGISGGGTNGSNAGYATIRNGVVRGARDYGIALGFAQGVQVTNMVVEFNAQGGVSVGENSRVTGNRVASNGSSRPGISAGGESVVADNTVSDHAQWGVICSGGCVITGNTVTGSGLDGIACTSNPGCLISGNTSVENTGYGIHSGNGAIVSGNTVYQNTGGGISTERGTTVSGNSSYFNLGVGILAAIDVVVENNIVTRNFAGGISMASSSVYRDNTVNANTGGLNVSGGIDLGGNACGGTAGCP